jgi:hypothetical protein
MSVRLPEADRAWLFAHAAETGSAVNAIIVRAVAEYREQVHSAEMQSAIATRTRTDAVYANETREDAPGN